MSKIAIIGFHNLHLMQFLYKYTELLDTNGVEYDVLYWDRDMDDNIKYKTFSGNKVVFSYKTNNFQPKNRKIIGFIRCLLFMYREIKKNQYNKLILLTTQTALPIYILCSIIRTKFEFIYDYRDLTYEYIGVCKKIILMMISKSQFTAISSLGFIDVLGKNNKFIVSHNVSNLMYSPINKVACDRIRVVYWGLVRQIEFNKVVCDLFGNYSRFELVYHGDGYVNELVSYCREKNYTNVTFSGRYTIDQITTFVKNTDILMNLYENDITQSLATTVKLYDGIRYGLPMLITKASYMGDLMKDNEFVRVIDVKTENLEQLCEWYYNLNAINNPYKSELLRIQDDDEKFEQKLMEFVKE